jgi:hypothetical protein
MTQPKKSFDFLQFLRKPHGIAFVLILLGIAGWAAWTFVAW